MMKMGKDEKLKKYRKTSKFKVIDTIPVPHPYCITPKHVVFASHNHCGILGELAITEGEKQGIFCGICKGKLSYKQHETALLVQVDDKRELKDIPGLKKYLMSIKDMCEKDGYAGFAFIQK